MTQNELEEMCSLIRTDRKPTVPDVAPVVRALYLMCGAGCCLHVVLDDGNVETDSVRWCGQWATSQGHRGCGALADVLLRCSTTQRIKLARAPYDPSIGRSGPQTPPYSAKSGDP